MSDIQILEVIKLLRAIHIMLAVIALEAMGVIYLLIRSGL